MNRFTRVVCLVLTGRKLLGRSPAQSPKPISGRRKPKWGLPGTVLLSLAKITLEEDLHQAIGQGEAALLHVINELHQLITTTSRQYRECLTKQIGALVEDNSALVTECRVLANELASELDEYWVLLRVLSDIVSEQSALRVLMDQEGLDSVATMFKRVEVVVLEEFEANKRKELELLKAQYYRIVEADLN